MSVSEKAWKPSFILGQPCGICGKKPVPTRLWRLHEVKSTDLIILPTKLVVQMVHLKRLMRGESAKVTVHPTSH